MSTRFNMSMVLEQFDKVTKEIDVFEIIECGFDILPKEYHEFWSWLFDDKVFHELEELGQIACYAPTKEIEENKRGLYEYVKVHPIAYDLDLVELKINRELPTRSYDECRAELYFQEERKAEEYLKQLYQWSDGFEKFVCNPISAIFLKEKSEDEIMPFLRKVDNLIMAKTLVLYPPAIRKQILSCYTDRLQREIMEDMQCYSDAKTFSLSACVEAEQKLQSVIEECWYDETQGNLEKYMALEFDINQRVRKLSGCRHYLFPKNMSVSKYKDGLLMTIHSDCVDFIDMQHVYDIGWQYMIEATAFVLYKYVLEEKGTVYIAIKGRRPLPEYEFDVEENQGDYFLFLYRCMKLKNCYRWIGIYDILEDRVNQFEQELYRIAKSEKGFLRQGKKMVWNQAVRKDYRNLILDKLISGDRLRNLLADIYGDAAKEIEIHREFSVNLFHGKCTSKNRLYNEEPIDIWCSNSDAFVGILLENGHPCISYKIFLAANYLSDIRSGLISDVPEMVDIIRLEKHTKIVLLVLVQKSKVNSILVDWLKLSENVVDKVEIRYRDIV